MGLPKELTNKERNPFYKKSQFRNIFWKNLKTLNLPFLTKKTQKFGGRVIYQRKKWTLGFIAMVRFLKKRNRFFA